MPLIVYLYSRNEDTEFAAILDLHRYGHASTAVASQSSGATSSNIWRKSIPAVTEVKSYPGCWQCPDLQQTTVMLPERDSGPLQQISCAISHSAQASLDAPVNMSCQGFMSKGGCLCQVTEEHLLDEVFQKDIAHICSRHNYAILLS